MNFLFDSVFGSDAIEFRRQCFRAGEIAAVCECFGTAPQLGCAVGVLRYGMVTEAASETVVSEQRFELGARSQIVRGVLRLAAACLEFHLGFIE